MIWGYPYFRKPPYDTYVYRFICFVPKLCCMPYTYLGKTVCFFLEDWAPAPRWPSFGWMSLPPGPSNGDFFMSIQRGKFWFFTRMFWWCLRDLERCHAACRTWWVLMIVACFGPWFLFGSSPHPVQLHSKMEKSEILHGQWTPRRISHSYTKWPIFRYLYMIYPLLWKITIFNRSINYKWAIFNSYVSLPEGTYSKWWFLNSDVRLVSVQSRPGERDRDLRSLERWMPLGGDIW